MQTPTLSIGHAVPGLQDPIQKGARLHSRRQSPRHPARRAYRTDFEDFSRFCKGHNLPYLPATPTTVALYIADRAGSLRSATTSPAG